MFAFPLGVHQILSALLWLLQQPADNWLVKIQAANGIFHGWDQRVWLQPDGCYQIVSMAELPPCTAHWEYFLAGLLQQYSTQPGPASTGRAQKAASCLLGSSLVCSIPLTLLRGCLAGRSCT